MFYFSHGFNVVLRPGSLLVVPLPVFCNVVWNGLKLKVLIKKKKKGSDICDVFVNRFLCLHVLFQVVRCVAHHCFTALCHGWRAVKGSAHTMEPHPGTWAPLSPKHRCTMVPQGLCLSTLLRPHPLLLPLPPLHCQLAMPALTSSRSPLLLQKTCPQTQLCPHSLLVLHFGLKTKSASSTSCPRAWSWMQPTAVAWPSEQAQWHHPPLPRITPSPLTLPMCPITGRGSSHPAAC